MLDRFFERIHHSFRYKLLLLVLFPLVIFVPLIIAFTLHRTYSFAEEQLYHKVHTDINVAKASFLRQQDKFLQSLTQLGESHAFYTALRQRDDERIKDQLQLLKVTEGFDFLHVVDLKGGWLFDDDVFAGEAKPSPLIDDVIHSGRPRVGLESYSSAYLIRERHSLAEKARVVGQDEPRTQLTDDKESKALVMRAVYPIKNDRGQTVALLEGGVLLNGNAALVDAIHKLVYGPGTVPDGGNGIISVVLDQARVATNLSVKTSEQPRRALGSTVPAVVEQTVLHKGKDWVGEVRTTGGTYLSAYRPLRDYRHKVIGMLEAGYLVAPLRAAYQRDLMMFGVLLLLLVLLAAIIAIFGARRIFKPIERIAEVIRAQEGGDDQRIGELKSRDEIGALARRFDHLLDLLYQRNAQIQRAADDLEHQVEARTRELRLKNAYLKNTIDLLSKTRRQLVLSEKFAALGELTAGIAHEINNPTAVILGNMDILIDELGAATTPVATEVSLIYEQVYRIRTIVDKLLKYSRASPLELKLQAVDINKVIEDTLLLVRHEAQRQDARIITRLGNNCVVQIDPQELQQVLINLLINAIHAIAPRGRIDIVTGENDYGEVYIKISDDGDGIDPEIIDRIFDPFYSTKGHAGTGLGLSVSYGLVQRYGGNLEVSSVQGEGTVFTVRLSRKPQMMPDMESFIDRPASNISTESESYYE